MCDAKILSKRLEEVCAFYIKLSFKNPQVQVSTLGGYETVTVAKLRILINLKPQRKKGKLYFKNGGKAHDAGVITEKYGKFLNSMERKKLHSIKL